MNDYISVVYAKKDTELSWPIRLGVIHDENYKGQLHDELFRCDLHQKKNWAPMIIRTKFGLW